MSKTSVLGIGVAFISLIVAFVLESDGQITALVKLIAPTAAMIVFGGTIGAVILSFPGEDLKRIGKIIGVVFKENRKDLKEVIIYFKELSIKTRKEGLLKIEEDISEAGKIDPIVQKGLQMVVDGTDPHAVRTILETEAYLTSERHKTGAAIFDAAGGFAPTMGIVGTVMGLIQILGSLEDPSTLGEKIATAFIATLYGISSANILFLPIGNKLKNANKREMKEKELIIEAILGIQEGLNPNTLEEKLISYLDKKESELYKAMHSGGDK